MYEPETAALVSAHVPSPDSADGGVLTSDRAINAHHGAIGRYLPGVIEGACRHLVKDRLDLTGARWGLQGAEAVLKLRAIRCNGDWDTYWAYHLAQERRRVHESRYADNIIPRAA